MIRFNFQKAKWDKFTYELDDGITDIKPFPENYNLFQKQVWNVASTNIPRGSRQK